MPDIKNLHLLGEIPADTMAALEVSGLNYKRFSSIFFKIIKYGNGECTIEVKQEKSFYKNYADQKRLIGIVHEVFDGLLPNIKIIVHASPYVEPVTDIVTPEWIRHNMTENHIRLKDIANETGIDKAQLSANISGDRELSQPVKAMFYYYFKSKQTA